MAFCINTNSAEFRTLQKRSGLPDFQLKALVSAYANAHDGEWPLLDQLPTSDSRNAIKEELHLSSNNSTSAENLLQTTGTNSVEEAVIKLNNQFRDTNISVTKVDDLVIVETERRPSKSMLRGSEKVDLSNVSSRTFIGQSLEMLAKLFGIQTNFMSIRELRDSGILKEIPDVCGVSAFVYNGNIFVNSDVASVDAPVHELLHVLLGSLKYTKPDLYYGIVQTAESLHNFDQRAVLYPNRSRSDLDEEIFVNEYARYLTGLESEFSNLDRRILSELDYNVSRTLDSILNGDNSVNVVPQIQRFSKSLKELGVIVNSHNMENKYSGYLDSATISRIMANTKQSLMEKGDLIERCN